MWPQIGGLRADVDAAGRVGRDQQHRVAAHLAADDQLLLVAAGQRAGVVSMPGVRTSYCSTMRSVSLRAPARLIQRSAHRRRPGLVAEDPVLPERGVEQQAVPVPVLGDVADAGLAPLARVPAGDVLRRRA